MGWRALGWVASSLKVSQVHVEATGAVWYVGWQRQGCVRFCMAVLRGQVGLCGSQVHHPCAIDADLNKCRLRAG